MNFIELFSDYSFLTIISLIVFVFNAATDVPAKAAILLVPNKVGNEVFGKLISKAGS